MGSSDCTISHQARRKGTALFNTSKLKPGNFSISLLPSLPSVAVGGNILQEKALGEAGPGNVHQEKPQVKENPHLQQEGPFPPGALLSAELRWWKRFRASANLILRPLQHESLAGGSEQLFLEMILILGFPFFLPVLFSPKHSSGIPAGQGCMDGPGTAGCILLLLVLLKALKSGP